MNTMAVIGLGYGDEGKGLTASYLCSHGRRIGLNPDSSTIVARFNGGQQAGHTVNHNGHRHVFSNFGAGTMRGVPTYWSQFCTFCPTSVINELEDLKQYNPKLYVHPWCPVTTPFDVFANRSDDNLTTNGTVGVGFGTTLQRQENYYKLFVQDLFYPTVLRMKLCNIQNYYKCYDWMDAKDVIELEVQFLESVEKVKSVITIAAEIPKQYKNIIFEGAQGILLDQDFGFFPNVTRSNTTCKNIYDIIDRPISEVYYVMRAYQTRHGNGFMSNENKPVTLRNNENETNKSHKYQGNFRTSEFDPEMINYALECDSYFHDGITLKNLVITCLDQIDIDPKDIVSQISTRFDKVLLSYSDDGENISIM